MFGMPGKQETSPAVATSRPLFPCPHSSLFAAFGPPPTGWEEGEARNPTEGEEEGKGSLRDSDGP
jgi:hypothetical protein